MLTFSAAFYLQSALILVLASNTYMPFQKEVGRKIAREVASNQILGGPSRAPNLASYLASRTRTLSGLPLKARDCVFPREYLNSFIKNWKGEGARPLDPPVCSL